MIKDILRKILTFLKLDLTKNLQYDRLTKEVIEKVVTKDSVCVDVGCHKGEILDLILKRSSQAQYAFEPIPDYFNNLQEKYGEKHHIFPYALSNQQGATHFNYVKNAPAYSGIKQRKYTVEPDIEQIEVQLEALDNIIPKEVNIDLLKIDVEGAELGVIQGGINTLKRCQPVVIFEFGLGASDYYDTTPAQIFEELVNKAGLRLFTLKQFLKNKENLTLDQFTELYENNKEYYFVAAE